MTLGAAAPPTPCPPCLRGASFGSGRTRRPLVIALIALLLAAPARAQAPQPQAPTAPLEDALRDMLLDRLKQRPRPGPAQQAAPPAPKPMQTTTIGGRTVAVWLPPDATPRPLPVIVFSHGFHGCNTQSTFVTRGLAAAGYLVLAPNHADAACGAVARGGGPEARFGRPGSWGPQTYADRRDDMNAVLDTVTRQVPWSSLIDGSKIGLAGHSLGGYTVLGLAGGWAEWRRADIRAVLALSPYAEPFARKGALDRIEAAVMIQGGTADIGITPGLRRPGGLWDKTPAPAWFVELRAAGHMAWTDLNPRFHETITRYAVAFFDAALKGAPKEPVGARQPDVADIRIK